MDMNFEVAPRGARLCQTGYAMVLNGDTTHALRLMRKGRKDLLVNGLIMDVFLARGDTAEAAASAADLMAAYYRERAEEPYYAQYDAFLSRYRKRADALLARRGAGGIPAPFLPTF